MKKKFKLIMGQWILFTLLYSAVSPSGAQQAVPDEVALLSEQPAIETSNSTPEVNEQGSLSTDNSAEKPDDLSIVEEVIFGIKTLLVLGGPVVWILLVVSVLGLTLALSKFLQFSRVNGPALDVIDEAINYWFAGNESKAVDYLNRSAVSFSKVILGSLERRGKVSAEILEEDLFSKASTFLRDFSHNLKPLELIYYLAPVMGLLGTVLGMIDAFRGLAVSAGAAGESSALAGGIWEALLTTAVGLSIAIPFAVMHSVLETKLENLTDRIGDMASRVSSRIE